MTDFEESGSSRAIREVSGMDPGNGPQPTVSEFAVHDYVRP